MNFKISSWAIRRPIPTLILFLLLAIAGWRAFVALPINANPNVNFPIVTVSVAQSGAAPSELENAVTRRVENAVSGLAGIRHITSTLSDGVSVTTVEFNLGTSTDRATADVRDAIAQVRAELPQTIQEPVISRVDIEGGAILHYIVNDATRSITERAWFVEDTLSRTLLTVPGVQRVQRLGGAQREVRVELIPERLEARGLSVDEVNAQLLRSNLDAPGGRIVQGQREYTLRILGSAVHVTDLAQRAIALPDGRWAPLNELARIEDGSSDTRAWARFNGDETVGFAVFRSRGASDTTVAANVDAALTKLEQAHPELHLQQVATTVDYTRASYQASINTLIEGAVLTVIVVLIFLRNWRATLVAAIALPLSILPTFLVMLLLDYTLNSITLLALTLVIGILVDDAIVEIENIERHLDQGKRPFQAAIDASDAIGFAVIAITATIVAVFLPVSFVGGVIGQYFTQFGITVSTAVLASLLVARLATPLLAAYLLAPRTQKHHDTTAPPKGLMKQYLALLERALQHRRLTLLAGGAFLGITLALVPLLSTGFLPNSDRDQSQLDVVLPPGTSLQHTDHTLQQLSRQIQSRNDVASVFAIIGGEDASGATDVAQGSLLIRLKPEAKHKVTLRQFEQSLRQMLAAQPDIRFSFRGDNAARDLSIILVGSQPQALQQAVEQLQQQMRSLLGITNVQINAPLQRPELLIRPRADEAARLGVATADISTVLRVATIGDIDANSARFNFPDRQVPVRVMLSAEDKADLDIVRRLRVSAHHGSVPLQAVADIRFAEGPAKLERFDRQRRVSVDADLRPGTTLGAALDAINQLPALQQLPDDVQRVEYGDAEYMNEMFTKFSAAMGFGILIVFAVLVLLFKDFLQPITILTALPLSLGGAIGGLLLYGGALDLPAVIGILMLMGIVTKNSILLVEFTIEKYRHGTPRHHALVQAGAERARPIVMTTIAMVAGMVPAAMGHGADAGFRAPMAIAVIGGLITSTLLSLVFVPVVFTYMDDLRHWLAPKLARLTSVTNDDRQAADRDHNPPI